MARFKRIDFSLKEYETINGLVMTGAITLTKLRDKMEKAMRAVEGEETMKLEDVITVARGILQDRLVVPPGKQQTPAWRAKLSNFLRANYVDAEVIKKAALWSKQHWKGPIYIDKFIFELIKNSSMPLFEVRPPTTSGFAAKEGEDDDFLGSTPEKKPSSTMSLFD